MSSTVPVLDELNSEREKCRSLQNELEKLKLFYSELESTNNHLVSATWREREMKKVLTNTLAELNRTQLLLETQNKRITESINYARRIQIAINSTELDLQGIFPQSFIFYIPKDVISGDFPWLKKQDNFVYVASVDCTGHGVPGAMMSMIGNLLLNDILNNNSYLLPSEVLLRLHNAVVSTLKQNQPDSNSNDGMDIALCRIDLLSNELVFSGAHRPLLHFSGNEIHTYQADKFPIGGIQYKGMNHYSDQVVKLVKGDSIIMFSDGLPDQIGGSEKRKLMTKGVREFFEKNRKKNSPELKDEMNKMFLSWKAENKQIDDVLLIEIKF
jgi:serine phosphatase RsbU (regulator of sigma subunit)